MRTASSRSDSACEFFTTGTIKPFGVSHANPMCTSECSTIRASTNTALSGRASSRARMVQKVTR